MFVGNFIFSIFREQFLQANGLISEMHIYWMAVALTCR
jgi:hypothetical protein